MSTLERAIVIAAKAHEGQVDKAGAPYILHPLRIMLRLSSTDERIVAVLHDAIEDSNLTVEDVEAEGFSRAILDALVAVTRRPEESYEEFVLRAAANDIGRRVKFADLEDNSDLSRIAHPTARDHERIAKYRRAMDVIRSGRGAEHDRGPSPDSDV